MKEDTSAIEDVIIKKANQAMREDLSDDHFATGVVSVRQSTNWSLAQCWRFVLDRCDVPKRSDS